MHMITIYVRALEANRNDTQNNNNNFYYCYYYPSPHTPAQKKTVKYIPA